MNGPKMLFEYSTQITADRRRKIRQLQEECFSHVSRKEIRECFIARGFGWIFALESQNITGQVELYKRKIRFDGRQISLGGLGGTCVTMSVRGKGIGTAMVKKGLEILKAEMCDVACLNADLKNHPDGGLYSQLGFRVMKRRISFEDVHGSIRHDSGEMFAPLCSQEIYDLIMNSGSTFHIGRGYW